MARFIMIVYVFSFCCIDVYAESLHRYMKDFDNCMNCNSIKYQKKYGVERNKVAIQKLKELYERNHFSKIERSNEPKIPKIIHQIWVGPRPLPEFAKRLAQTWKDFHPDWQYMLWTNGSIEKIKEHFLPGHVELYEKLEDYRFKADLLRYYILYLYGGLYVDMDFKCLTSFDELHHYYDFYAGISSNDTKESINNALIASCPHHIILKSIIEGIVHVSHDNCMSSLGVFYFSDKVLESIFTINDKMNIFLPVNLLYVFPFCTKRKPSSFIALESMAVHFWASGSNAQWKDNA